MVTKVSHLPSVLVLVVLKAHLAWHWSPGGKAWVRIQRLGSQVGRGRERGIVSQGQTAPALALMSPPHVAWGPGLRSEVHQRQPGPCPRQEAPSQHRTMPVLWRAGQQGMGVSPNIGPPLQNRLWFPGREAPGACWAAGGAGGFVWQEEGPWRLRNKAWDRAGWGCGWPGQSVLRCWWGQGSAYLLPPPPQPAPPTGLLSSGSWLSHVYSTCCWNSRMVWLFMGCKRMKWVKSEPRIWNSWGREEMSQNLEFLAWTPGLRVLKGTVMAPICCPSPCWALDTCMSLT
jgi:hypothetical protein